MQKAISCTVFISLGLIVFAILGSFCDALTGNEAAEIIGSCLVVLAVLSKLPAHK